MLKSVGENKINAVLINAFHFAEASLNRRLLPLSAESPWLKALRSL